MGVTVRRVLAAGLAGALLVLEASIPATAAEPGHPSGTFTLHRTVAYLHEIDWEDGRFYDEEFYITATSLTDDETSAEELTVEASPGDGRGSSPSASRARRTRGPATARCSTTTPARSRRRCG